ncbi:MAG: EamA family transporter, partial [Chloroflexota bacterium]|nr:EamA family transporter [Chloroflexota bacterium]
MSSPAAQLPESVNRIPSSRPSLPPTALVLLAGVSVQLGSAVAKHLFVTLGPAGAALLRVGFAAIVLLILWRPQLRGYSSRDLAMAALFGLVTAAMNFSFYLALDRIPLGVAVTLEFAGPLGVVVAGSRRLFDLVWVLLAAGGIVLLAPWGGLGLDPAGAGFALLAGMFWAGYILLSSRVGGIFSGGRGLALALSVGGVALLPIGIAGAGAHLLQPYLLLAGLAVALLSGVVPYSLELEALRSLPTRVFGILMSLEPAIAATIGFVVLG